MEWPECYSLQTERTLLTFLRITWPALMVHHCWLTILTVVIDGLQCWILWLYTGTYVQQCGWKRTLKSFYVPVE